MNVVTTTKQNNYEVNQEQLSETNSVTFSHVVDERKYLCSTVVHGQSEGLISARFVRVSTGDRRRSSPSPQSLVPNPDFRS